MEAQQGLPDDIDPDLWFECRHHAGARDYILREPWQTFPGRIHAWCQERQESFRVSKSESARRDSLLGRRVPHRQRASPA